MDIYTIGHSTHTREHFLEMLGEANIEFVADVRAIPASRKHPQYTKDNMRKWLQNAGIDYHHFPLLGGRRSRSGIIGESLNAGWRNQSFHHYADYTLGDEFKRGLTQLLRTAKKCQLAYLCSERHPARCHRLIISNCLQANGWNVYHLMDNSNGRTEIIAHELGRWGANPIIEEDGTVVYPK
ncbi:DUF488 family protein [Gracilibacillus dipsosauri]|uniref:DUF488 domain-containing protein n=1 Tax=Gracilibacillus dipsosauri TaxID=178340 RepID=UPI002409E99D